MPIIGLILVALSAIVGLNLGLTDKQPTLGAFSDPFLSVQLAASPSNGKCLETDGTNNLWDTCATGGGSGTISTSTQPSISNLAFWTTSGAFPELLGSVATTTLTASSPLSLSNPVAKVGGVNSVLTIDTSGAWSGTAGSLAANGANCTAGNFPLGVDALGAVETCTDAWTEAENTAAGYVANTRTLTVAGTADQITSSAGAQDLSANRTWTLSLPSFVQFPGTASSSQFTLTGTATSSWNYGNSEIFGMLGVGKTATTTIRGDNATSTFASGIQGTGLNITGHTTLGGNLTFNNVTGSTWAAFCTTITGGAGLCDGTDDGGAGTSAFEIATTSDIAVPQLAYITKTSGRTTIGSVATGTISSANSALTVTGSRYSVGGATVFTVSTTTNTIFTGTPGQVLGYTDTGWTGVATTTFSSGLTYSAGNVTNTGVLSNIAGNGITVSGATGNVTISANDRMQIATTTDIAIPQLAYFTKTAGLTTLGSTATGTVSAGTGISVTAGQSVIGSGLTITNTGVTSALAGSGIAVSGATGAVTFSTNGLNAVATTTDIAVPQVAYFTQTGGLTTLGSVATGTISSANSALTVTGSRYSLGGATTFTVATTSTNMFTGTAGQVLAFLDGGWIGVATTTLATISGTLDISTQSNLTAGDALTLTNDDIDFDGGASPGGSLGGTWASPTIDDLFLLNTGDTGSGDYTFDTSTFHIDSTGDEIGIGTTTPVWPLTVSASTEPQLALSAGAGVLQWTMRNAGGFLYFATTTVAGTATSTPAGITVDGNAGSSGLYVGTSTPGATGLAVVGTVFLHGLTTATGGTNEPLCITATPNEVIEETTTVCAVSSRRFKHDITKLDVNALDMLMQFKPVEYSYNDNIASDYKDRKFGFIAEDVADIDPHLAEYGQDGLPRSLDDRAIISVAVKAIQEMWDKLLGLDKRITDLETKNAELERRLEALEHEK